MKTTKNIALKEVFWSESSAKSAGERLVKKGYTYIVKYAMLANGAHEWILEVYHD